MATASAANFVASVFVCLIPPAWKKRYPLCIAPQIYHGTTITILDIAHRPVFYLNQEVSEPEFCLRLQVEPTQMGPIENTIQ
jgi:hypothetical protein